MLQQLIPILITVSLACLIVAVGLNADRGDLLYVFRRPLQLVRALVAVNVIVPLSAMLLVALFPLEPAVKAGILLMAVSPVPPLVPGKELKTGGSKAYSYGLYLALIVLAVVIVPLTVSLIGETYGRRIVLAPGAVARNVLLSVILPLVVGVAIARMAPAFAKRVAGMVEKIAMLLVLLAFLPLLVVLWPGIVSLAGNGALLAMALVSAIALLGGHLLGGPALGDRGALAMAAAVRHPGLAIMIASANTTDKRVTAAILAYLLVGLVVGLPYQIWLKRRAAALGEPVAA